MYETLPDYSIILQNLDLVLKTDGNHGTFSSIQIKVTQKF